MVEGDIASLAARQHMDHKLQVEHASSCLLALANSEASVQGKSRWRLLDKLCSSDRRGRDLTLNSLPEGMPAKRPLPP